MGGGKIEITSLPAENVDSNGWIHIKTAEELAYLIKNGDSATVAAGANISSTRADGVKKYHICPGTDLDMGDWKDKDKPTTAVSFTNTIIDAGKWATDTPTVNQTCDDGCYTIEGLTLANGIFGNANGVTVQNLNIEGATIGSNTAEGVGIIANTATGSLTLTNITVSGTVTGANKVGGLVGYIGRSTPTDRADKSVVATLTDCSSSAKVTATVNNSYAGYLVGCLSGYDPAELLTFTNCSKLDGSTIINSNGIISTANKASFSNITEDDNHLLGGEIYRRGTIKFNDNQFFYRWDGITNKTTVTIEPLLANTTYDSDVTAAANKYVVYSPFDLAAVRAKSASPAAIYLRQDVDMNGQGTDGKYNVPSNFAQSVCSSTDDNNFNPFNYVTTLDGRKSDSENYSIYNLSISQIAQERAAFILYAGGTTYHQNINFRNCCTVAVHKDVATDAKAYGAIVCSNIDATYYMTNVHAYDCKVFALQKVGTLAARVNGTSTLTNCTVNNCYVENYQCDISERFSSGEKSIGSWTVTVYADFYPHGEVGGMFGFIQGSSTLTNCKVNGTTIYAYGQDDKMATVDGSFLAKIGIAGLGYYLVPGRHVSKMIGNIRATGTVKLTGCTVDGDSKCTKRWDKHNNTYDYIGQAYIVKYVDSEGTVTVDGKGLTIANCNKYTQR